MCDLCPIDCETCDGDKCITCNEGFVKITMTEDTE
jgi:hypothetical protein